MISLNEYMSTILYYSFAVLDSCMQSLFTSYLSCWSYSRSYYNNYTVYM